MMNGFRQTRLWKSAFGPRPDIAPEEQGFFRHQLEQMRDRAAHLVAHIAADMPGYTVHDITHLDALWETADLVAEEGLELNPPEAFVFGGAILLHDAGMTLVAYPGGLPELMSTTEWADTVALMQAQFKEAPSANIERQVKIEVLRRLHASKASQLATQGWTVRDQRAADKSSDQATAAVQFFLIDHAELRAFYGDLIGTIAHSHWWSLERVEREFTKILGGWAPQTKFPVDSLKIAGLLRVADALHLDSRRAPTFLRVLDRPSGVSNQHWTFQGRLAFPHSEGGDAIAFTASPAFSRRETDAWWLSYDAISMADRELRDTDLLLRSNGRPGFWARRIKGARDPGELAQYVKVNGWKPVETRINASDIPHLVATFGGKQLYGDDPWVPLRELLQNGMDAIQARRKLQGRLDWGRIIVTIADRTDGYWLTVEDNGVGMSEGVLTGTLLDFGSSLWRSPNVKDEFPGLASKGMNAIGQFGIGFFSVFMIGDHVRVITRKYDLGDPQALVLEFEDGLRSRPILSPALNTSAPIDGGTRVEVKLRGDPRGEDGLALMPSSATGDNDTLEWLEFPESLASRVAVIAPASEVSIDVDEFGTSRRAVSAGDWLTVEPAALLARIPHSWDGPNKAEIQILATIVRPIKGQDGTVYGRAALWDTGRQWRSTVGALCSGGLRVTGVPHFCGIAFGEVSKAARDAGRMIIDQDAFREWAQEQAALIHATSLEPQTKAVCANYILSQGIGIPDLPVACRGTTWLSVSELRQLIVEEKQLAVYAGEVEYDDDWDYVSKLLFQNSLKLSETTVTVPSSRRESGILSLIEHLIGEEWGEFEETEDDKYIVGDVDGEDIVRRITLYARNIGNIATQGT